MVEMQTTNSLKKAFCALKFPGTFVWKCSLIQDYKDPRVEKCDGHRTSMATEMYFDLKSLHLASSVLQIMLIKV